MIAFNESRCVSVITLAAMSAAGALPANSEAAGYSRILGTWQCEMEIIEGESHHAMNSIVTYARDGAFQSDGQRSFTIRGVTTRYQLSVIGIYEFDGQTLETTPTVYTMDAFEMIWSRPVPEAETERTRQFIEQTHSNFRNQTKTSSVTPLIGGGFTTSSADEPTVWTCKPLQELGA